MALIASGLHVAEVRYDGLGLGRVADDQTVGVLVVEQRHHISLEQFSQLLYLHSFDPLDQVTRSKEKSEIRG